MKPMKTRHPLELINDRGRFFIARWSDVVEQRIKLSGFFETRLAAECALKVWLAADQMEKEIAERN
jgi:hypothetical protein